MYGRYAASLASLKSIKSIVPGKKPKLTISAKESNSLPIFDLTCKARATIPSKKIKNARCQNAIKKHKEIHLPKQRAHLCIH